VKRALPHSQRTDTLASVVVRQNAPQIYRLCRELRQRSAGMPFKSHGVVGEHTEADESASFIRGR